MNKSLLFFLIVIVVKGFLDHKLRFHKFVKLNENKLENGDYETVDIVEPMFSQSYDPLAYPTQITTERDLEDNLMRRALKFYDAKVVSVQEKCYLVGLEDKSLNEREDGTKFTMEESLTELSELAGAAGLSVVGSTYQRVQRPNLEYYIGQGKVKDIAKAMMRNKCYCVIFDVELSPSQQKNLEVSTVIFNVKE